MQCSGGIQGTRRCDDLLRSYRRIQKRLSWCNLSHGKTQSCAIQKQGTHDMSAVSQVEGVLGEQKGGFQEITARLQCWIQTSCSFS